MEGDGFNSRLAVFQIAAFMGVKNSYFKVKNPFSFSVWLCSMNDCALMPVASFLTM